MERTEILIKYGSEIEKQTKLEHNNLYKWKKENKNPPKSSFQLYSRGHFDLLFLH